MPNLTANKSDNNFEGKTQQVAREIFKEIGKEQPSTFSLSSINGKMMAWSITKPDLKVNLFRLVDVLASLRSAKSIARHVHEYLGTQAKEFSSILAWSLGENPGIIRSFFTAQATKFGVRQMAKQFIAGIDAKDALPALKKIRRHNSAFTIDLLGEYAVSEIESENYLKRYLETLDQLAAVKDWPMLTGYLKNHRTESSAIAISVKLTALYSQCSSLNYKRSIEKLSERLYTIAIKAASLKATICVDAEDAGNNHLIYEVFKRVFSESVLRSFHLPAIALQAYAKNSEVILNDLLSFAEKRGAPIGIRLVKGAYWDHENTIARQNGWESPLFANKESTDANFERLTDILFANHNLVVASIASHNVRSLSHAIALAEHYSLDKNKFEIQLLYGMADPIGRVFSARDYLVRYYVPLGEILPGMGYLVRRLLENSSNESFLRRSFFEGQDIESLIQPPKFIN
ncbi:MAG TPA: proline dehydrogenase family protein [Oligoflexia bacterium]|nr:proline dehydrogenase family protein [Oligoflexia bacterium]HMP27157.1 proline dehydrogenase family protein [Oligoflexia bacterium]